MKHLAAALESACRQVRGGIQSWVGHGLVFLVVAMLLPRTVMAQVQPEVAPPETGGDTPELTYQRVEHQTDGGRAAPGADAPASRVF